MKLYNVYIKGDYAGVSTDPKRRKSKHNWIGNVGNIQLIKIFTKFRDARDYEDKLHAQGYRGADNRLGKKLSEATKAKMSKPKLMKYEYTTPAGKYSNTRDAGKANGVSRSTANRRCRHLTKWPEWSRIKLN